jgi:hypothetical protein
MRLSILADVEAGWHKGCERSVDVPLAERYSENESCGLASVGIPDAVVTSDIAYRVCVEVAFIILASNRT